DARRSLAEHAGTLVGVASQHTHAVESCAVTHHAVMALPPDAMAGGRHAAHADAGADAAPEESAEIVAVGSHTVQQGAVGHGFENMSADEILQFFGSKVVRLGDQRRLLLLRVRYFEL